VDTLDADDVTQGEEALTAFLALCHAARNKSEAMTIHAADDDQPFVIVEGEAEILALTPKQAEDAVYVLSKAAVMMGAEDYTVRHTLKVVEVLNEALADLIGAGGETVH